jgi:hypothetical protein
VGQFEISGSLVDFVPLEIRFRVVPMADDKQPPQMQWIDGPPTFPKDEVEKFFRWLRDERGAKGICPDCGRDTWELIWNGPNHEWGLVSYATKLLLIEKSPMGNLQKVPDGKGEGSFLVICSNCGLLRLYSLRIWRDYMVAKSKYNAS